MQPDNLLTGESVGIVPQPEPGEPALRWYWDSPLIISPHSNTRLYFASQRLYRSDDRGNSWKPVSGDLSRQIDRNRIRLMDRVWSVDAIAKNASSCSSVRSLPSPNRRSRKDSSGSAPTTARFR